MKKIIILSTCLLSAPVFGMNKAFNALCTSIRYVGASYFPLTQAYGYTKSSLKSFDEEKTGISYSLDEATSTWIETRKSNPKNYQLINVAGKEIPVEKGYMPTVAVCQDHTLSHFMGKSTHPYSVIVPDIFPIERLRTEDPHDRGLTVSEYQQLLENDIKIDPIADNDGAHRQIAKLIKSATKEEIEAVLQHESGHGKRSAGVRLASAGSIIAASVISFDPIFMKKLSNSIASFKGATLQSASILAVSALLGIAYHHLSSALYHAVSRHEEYKADDAVRKAQIPGQISFLQKNQITEEIIMRELKKNGVRDDSRFLKKILNPTFETHPTNAQRIARLQKRLRDQA